MTQNLATKRVVFGAFSLVLISWNPAKSADTIDIKGLIEGRSGATMIVKTADSETLTVMLNDTTEVGQIQGVFKARRKEMSMAALIPGLAVQIKAIHGTHNQLVAKSVKFKGDDLKRAEAIQAGLHETKAQTQQNTADINKNRQELEQQRAALQAQQEALQQQQAEVAAHKQKIAENKAAIDAAIARFGQLDDYYILDELTVYFGNGKVNVEPKYIAPLLKLAQKTKSVEGYMIEIKGYASSVGSESVNQKLSEDRADNVANILVQQGHIPITHLLAPAAMGESQQVGNDNTADGQAQNRRVVVRILQNKGVAGLPTGGDF
jgi:outer membrane protein OmpA-like peptidoglycan-associated protein